MKLALLGYPIQHSLSPKLYQQFLGQTLERYDLLEFEQEKQIPALSELAKIYDGMNITAPYKKHFFDQVEIENEIVRQLGAINTISFTQSGKVLGTNTDVLAVESLLTEFKSQYSSLYHVLLGNGVMAKMTMMLARQLKIPFTHFYRSVDSDLSKIDLNTQVHPGQMMVINACSREFVFLGKIPASAIFWDYNYAFKPHQSTLPLQVSSYIDGKEMLKRQALSAIQFWKQSLP